MILTTWAGLSDADRRRYGRRSDFAFSLSVTAHEMLQFAGLVTGSPRISGIGPQHYHAYPGTMTVEEARLCDEDYEFAALTATAQDLSPDLAKDEQV